MMLLDPLALKRALLLLVLLAVLLFGWEPLPRSLARPPRRRETDRPLPDSSELHLRAARASRAPHRRLPAPRQAARRRLS